MSDREPSGAAVGWIMFAGFMMILAGSFSMLSGLGAILNPSSLGGVATDSILEQSADTWGWWHLLIGLVVFLAGFGVFKGNVLARTVGVIAASLSAISAFMWMPLAPWWGIIVIFVDVSVIWALTVHGRDVEKAAGMDM